MATCGVTNKAKLTTGGIKGTLCKYATAYVDTPPRNVDLAGTPDAKKSKIPIGYQGIVKMYTLYGNPYQLRFSVSRRAVPRIGLVRNVTSRLYYEFCLVENITEQVRRGLVQYITSRPYILD